MNIDVVWDNSEKTAIRYDFHAGWDWDDLIQVLRQDDAMFESVDHFVHIIFNLKETPVLPANPSAKIDEIASARPHARVGLIVLVATGPWIQKTARFFYKVHLHGNAGIKGLKGAATVDEARRLIAAYDQSVD
jgi:hypothetical protein